jgi:hypothetical protein
VTYVSAHVSPLDKSEDTVCVLEEAPDAMPSFGHRLHGCSPRDPNSRSCR